jgi:hypothetical protein
MSGEQMGNLCKVVGDTGQGKGLRYFELGILLFANIFPARLVDSYN